MTENFGPGVTTLKLRGITLKQYSDKEFTFEITPAELIPVLKTLENKKGLVKGRISPIQNPSEHISHLAFAVLPVKSIEESLNDNNG